MLPFSERAVLTDPAAVSGHLALFSVCLLLPSSHYNAVGLRSSI
jgi:hypothetical protein